MNSSTKFVHLRCHSEFSISDSILRIKDIIKKTAENSMPSIALTDLNNVFALLKFYRTARDNQIKPVLGAEILVETEISQNANNSNKNNPKNNNNKTPNAFPLLVLVKNNDGYKTLCELMTKAYLEINNSPLLGQAVIKRKWLQDLQNPNLIALSGFGNNSEIGNFLSKQQFQEAQNSTRFFQKIFGETNFFIEIQRIYNTQDLQILQDNQIQIDNFASKYQQQEQLIFDSLKLADELNVGVVATQAIQFMQPQDFEAHEVRVCISEGDTLHNAKRIRRFEATQYFKTAEQMCDLFADLPESVLQNSVEIAKRCNVELVLGKNFLPIFPTPNGESLDDYLVSRAKSGLEERLIELFPDENIRQQQRQKYDERLQMECQTIIKMGFPGYFLIVADFINWGKNHGVPVGPGRGSGAGSLVAFSLRITDIDPLPYALLFERFLNPERVSMPDFDVDFCQDNRGRVIEYVREHYGSEAVSQIATFGTLSSKAVIRDVGRVLDLPYSLCDKISKLIPVVTNKPLSLEKALQEEPKLNDLLNEGTSDEVENKKRLFELSQKLEDLTRNVGMHAGGVLIAPGKISDYCPMYKAVGAETSTISQFDKDDVEKIGLVKFDFLGLRNLTIIELALEYIQKLTNSAKKINLMELGFADQKTYDILKNANTTAVFQLESDGMKKLLKRLQPDRFEDIIAVLALYRPGPLGSGMVDDFIERKKGNQEIDYFHPDLKQCLESTYGVIIYQEQVMQISQIIGGYTLGGADMLRRAMGKKKPEEMAKHRTTIAEGAKKKGYKPELAEHLFDLMAKFAEYGFNKSHTAAYAVVTYQTAWLKAHYPAEFMAATMSSDLDNTDTIKNFYDDCIKNNGLTILPPSVNESAYKFVPTDKKTIRYGLGAIKGIGESAVEAIVAERNKNGKFSDFFEFCSRCDKSHVNKRVLEGLIRAGAFDELEKNRHKLLENVQRGLDYAEQCQNANSHKQSGLGLFVDNGDSNNDKNLQKIDYIDAEKWSVLEALNEEKLALGFFISGHPFTHYKNEFFTLKQQLKIVDISKVVNADFADKNYKNGKYKKEKSAEANQNLVYLIGMISNVKSVKTKAGKKMKIVTLEDESNDKLNISFFSDILEQDNNDSKLEKEQIVMISGEIYYDFYNKANSLKNITKIYTVDEVRKQFGKRLHFVFSEQKYKKDALLFKDALEKFKAQNNHNNNNNNNNNNNKLLPISVHYKYCKNDAVREYKLKLGDNYKIDIQANNFDNIFANLKDKFGSDNVMIRYN